jgi:hypothetical protein
MIHDPKHERKRQAQHNTSDDGKIERRVAALKRNVAGQAAAGEQDAEKDQPLPEFSQRIQGNHRCATFYLKFAGAAAGGRRRQAAAGGPQ